MRCAIDDNESYSSRTTMVVRLACDSQWPCQYLFILKGWEETYVATDKEVVDDREAAKSLVTRQFDEVEFYQA